MTQINKGDFIKLDYDMFANQVLVQTTNEEKGKKANLQIKSYSPLSMIVGKNFLLPALDLDVIGKKKNDSNKLSLSPENAFGKRRKDLLKTLPKSSFNEHKVRPVVGAVYDFNGMIGVIKSITSGRIFVDFNNPLSGKDIELNYTILDIITDIKEKIFLVLNTVFKLPQKMFSISIKDKDLTLSLAPQLISSKDLLKKTLTDFITDLKTYSLKIESFKKD